MICLYRYYTKREGLYNHSKGYLSFLKKLGPAALNMLLSGSDWAIKADMIDEFGDEVFAFGLLIGEEEYFNLYRNDTGDITLSFLHEKITHFLGAFYFIKILSDGRSLKSVLCDQSKKPIELMNKSFLEFCLSFILKGKNSEGRAFDRDKLSKRFFKCILAGCDPQMPLTFKKIWENVRGTCADKMYSLLEMCAKHSFNVIWFSNSKIVVWLDSFTDAIGIFIHNCKQLSGNQYTNVYLCVQDGSKLFKLPHGDVNKLEIGFKKAVFGSRSTKNVLRLEEKSSCCHHHLTHLSIVNHLISYNTFKALSETANCRRLPELSKLSFVDCESDDCVSTIHLPVLFKYPWDQLRQLNLYKSHLTEDDINVLFLSATCQDGASIPNLRSLILSVVCVQGTNRGISKLWGKPCFNITSFVLDSPTQTIYGEFCSALANSKFPHLVNLGILVGQRDIKLNVARLKLDKLEFHESLTLHNFIGGEDELYYLSREASKQGISRLDISHSLGITGALSSLLCHRFEKLCILTLSDCGLNSNDLSSLAQANTEDKLPKLRHLDISCNGCLHSYSGFKSLLKFSSKWNQLTRLDVSQTSDLCHFYDSISAIAGRDCLQSLKELSFSLDYFHQVGPYLRNVRILHILVHDERKISAISEEKRQGLLPSLHTVCIRFAEGSPGTKTRLFDIEGVRLLTALGVSCHLAISPEPPYPARRCQCEKSAATFCSLSLVANHPAENP